METLSLTKYEEKEIFAKNNINKIPLLKTNKKNNLKTKHPHNSESKNYIFYSCYKKNYKCTETGKIDKINKNFIITKYCDTNIEHFKLDYKALVKLLESYKYTSINYKEDYIQKFFIYYMINKKNITDFSNLNKKYVDIFGINIKLSKTKTQITKIKNKYLDEYKGLDLVQLSNLILYLI